MVHRDVKPENILLDDNGVAKLTDFGIARRITIQRASGGPTLAGTGLPVGTPQYMAPEQLRGEEVDQRADIYALGSVLYEMLTGLPPHIADTPYEVASLVLSAPIAPPASRNPAIWPELEQVMLKALSRKPVDRYANATSFAEALQDALLAHDIELIEPASAVKSSYVKFRPSQPLAPSANGAAAGIAAAGIAGGMGNESSDPGSIWSDGQPRDPAEPPAIPVSGAPPAGNPPRWPPVNQRRNEGGGGPGRKILILALIGALVVLTACAGVAYAIGVFPPGGRSPTASATQGGTPTETLAPTTTTGPGTPTSTPAPTNTAKSGATPSDTAQPSATATMTATSAPGAPTLSVPSSIVLNNNGGTCEGVQTVTNNGPQVDGWTWVVTGPSLPPSFQWSLSPPPWNTGLPQATAQPQGFMWSVRVRFYCSEYAGPYTLHLHDSYSNDFPTVGVTMSKP